MTKPWDDRLDLGNTCLERSLLPTHFTEFTNSKIYMGGASDIELHYLFSRWQATYHTILYTASGKGQVETTSGFEDIFTNSLLILPAGSSFRLHYADEPWEFGWIILQDIPHWLHLKQREVLPVYCQSAQIIYHLLCLIYYQTDYVQRAPMLSALHEQVYSTLDVSHAASERESRLKQLFHEVEEQLHFPWTIEEMAKRVYYSPPHFHRLCVKAFDCSPMQKLAQLRMQRACYLLQYTEWPVNEVASRVGYSDPFNFSTRFKKIKGLSPRAYREKYGSSSSV